MWQVLHRELHPQGLEIVTVALDTGGIQAARPSIEKARPEHSSLIDRAHLLDELYGFVNVPMSVWIDENGMVVRPPEPAYPQRPPFLGTPDQPPAAPLDPVMQEVRKMVFQPEPYLAALRDWVAQGSASRFALSPEEVVNRSRPRPMQEAAAAAHFELAQHLHIMGRTEDAIAHFRSAYHLQPDNWTYKRQAWRLLPPGRDPVEVYGGDWLSDVRKIGAENYYSELDL